MSDDPKHQKPGPPVPSFDELKAPKRPAAAPPSADLGQEEKTATISADVLRKVLQQSQVGAPIEPPQKPAPLALQTSGKLPLTGVAPPRQAPPPPGGQPKGPGVTTDPDTVPVNRQAKSTAAPTAPLMPVVRAPPPPPGGARPMPTHPKTDRMDPVTPDMLPGPRASPGRALAPVQTAAPATRPADVSLQQTRLKPDPSLQQTQLSQHHRGDRLPDPTPTAPTVIDERPRGARPSPPRSHSVITQPGIANPFLSPRSEEPASSEKPAVPSSTVEFEPEPQTRNERPASRPPAAGPAFDIEADIVSEVKKLQTDPGSVSPLHADLITDRGNEPATAAAIDVVEVLAHPAPTGRRIGALLVDALVLAGVDVIIAIGVLTAGKAPVMPERVSVLDALSMRFADSLKLMIAIAVLAVAFAAAYGTLFAVAWSGRTLGRRLFGLHLVDRRGRTPSTGRAIARSICAVFSFALFLSGFWWFLFDRKGQALHDKLCSTFVVRLGPSRT